MTTDLWEPSVRRPTRRLSSPVVGVLVAVASLLVVAFFLLTSRYRVFVIPSNGMEPTLPVGSAVGIDRTDHSPRDGDIIVFRDPYSGHGNYIKRVIGVGGETVVCCTKGSVTRGGVTLKESYTGGDRTEPFAAVTVPDGRLWVLGDHRSNSADSRSHVSDGHYGTVPVSEVVGTVRFTGSRAQVYETITGRAAVVALPLGILTSFVLTLIRRRRT